MTTTTLFPSPRRIKRTFAQTLLVSAAGLLLFGAVSYASSAAATEWVEFRAASAPPTPFQIKRATALGEEVKPKQGALIRGKLFRPRQAGPSPAVVMIEGCRGLRPFLSSWAKAISDWGYTALLVDSFGLRDDKEACSIGALRQEASNIVFHAYGALEFLGQQAFIVPDRIAVMGWSTGGFLNTVLEDGVQHLFDQRFRAAIAFYPNCRLASSGRFTAPLLVLVGANDDWSLATDCERMIGSGKEGLYPAELVVYPKAYNAFDDPGAGIPHEEGFTNLLKNPARGVTIGYAPAARADAMRRVNNFLDHHLAD